MPTTNGSCPACSSRSTRAPGRCAGSTPATRRGSGDNLTVNELSTTGPLIGSLFSGWSVNETTIEPGQLLIAMTDGIVEARRGAEEQFGLAGVVQTVRGLRRPDPKEAVTETVEAVRLFTDDWRRDDVTCVALALDVEDD
jgi:serine phosphatase RsbU (regulator of sigma subunit)